MSQRVLLLCAAAALALAAASCQKPPEVTGTVTYRGRAAMPAAAVLEVQLADVSKPNAPAVILARRTYTSLVGPPYHFALRPDVRNLDPHGTYAVQARILVAGKLFMVNTRRAAVNRANPTLPIEVRLDPVPTTIGD